MKLVTFKKNNEQKLGTLSGDGIVDLNAQNNRITDNMLDFLIGGEQNQQLAVAVLNSSSETIDSEEVSLLSPLTNPTSVGDGYAFPFVR